MTGVERVRGAAAFGAVAPRRPGGGFQVSGGAGAAAPESVPPGGPPGAVEPAGLAALLALQDEEARPRDRAARRHAGRLLAGLDRLHGALLGRGQPDLAGLAGLLEGMPEPADDPVLREAVAEVALRVRIELARYGEGGEG